MDAELVHWRNQTMPAYEQMGERTTETQKLSSG